jgi:SSS family solute:Na+ symporter
LQEKHRFIRAVLSPWLIIGFVVLYFIALVFISHITSRGAGNKAYFLGNNQSPWYAVAFGMIGDSLSGVTYISVPGQWAMQNSVTYSWYWVTLLDTG